MLGIINICLFINQQHIQKIIYKYIIVLNMICKQLTQTEIVIRFIRN